MASKRTVMICSNYGWTVYNFRMSLIKTLKSQGYRVVVVTQFDGYEDKIRQAADNVVPLFISRKGVNPLVDLLTIADLARYFMLFKPSFFLGFTVKPVIYGSIVSKIFKVQVIVMITGLGTTFISENWITAAVKNLYRFSLSSIAIAFFQNSCDKNLFIKHGLVKESICRDIPGSGIDIERFAYSKPPKSKAFIFLLVARMLWDKGVGEYVKASQVIRGKYPHVIFQLLGPLGVENRTSIHSKEVDAWSTAGVIEYLGEAEDVRPYIEKADCVVLPSYREGTPRVLLEASAMGRPVVATNVPGCSEVVQDNVTGLLCEPRDHLDLAHKLEAMLNLPAEKRLEMGLCGRKKIRDEFRQEIVCDLYLNAIEEFK